jgi:flagellar secretion chaperone FliS
MFVPRGQFGARNQYQSLGLSSRVEGATPHELVVIMFEEALGALDAMALAARRRDFAQRGLRQSRALAIIGGLETSLDHSRGGEIANGLASIYREARRLVLEGGRDNDADKILEARTLLGEIADAWTQIGERRASA